MFNQKYYVKRNKNNFAYIELGTKYNPKYVWVSNRIIKKDKWENEIIDNPTRAWIDIKESGNIVLKPSSTSFIAIFEIESGYRGRSEYRIKTEIEKEWKYYMPRSERGSLGRGWGAIVQFKSFPFIYDWDKWGKTYGRPSEGCVIIQNLNTVEEMDGMYYKDYLELKKELL